MNTTTSRCLIELSKNAYGWNVKDGERTIAFATIELASDYLIGVCNIHTDTIDEALIEMYANGWRHAFFNEDGQLERIGNF